LLLDRPPWPPEPGVPIQLLGGKVRDDVLAATGGNQRPYVSASITGKPIYLVPAEQSTTAVKQGLAASATVPDMPERTWDRVRETRSIEALEMFIKQFPGTISLVRESPSYSVHYSQLPNPYQSQPNRQATKWPPLQCQAALRRRQVHPKLLLGLVPIC
jgi:hypothetical protein